MIMRKTKKEKKTTKTDSDRHEWEQNSNDFFKSERNGKYKIKNIQENIDVRVLKWKIE